MTLLDRISRSQSLTPSERVTGHRVENAFKLYCHGIVTRTAMINFFNIPANMETDFDKFKTKYDSFPATTAGNLNREKWLMDLEACIFAIQMGDITKANFNTFLGLTLDEG